MSRSASPPSADSIPVLGWTHGDSTDRVESARGGSRSAIDLADPRRGVAIQSDNLLGIDLRAPCRPVEHWLRGADVTAVYEPEDARRLRVTAMWRLAAAPAGIDVWELVVSAQTSLPESDSSLAVVSDVAAAGCLHGDWSGEVRPASADAGAAIRWNDRPSPRSAAVLIRRPGPTSLFVAAHPADARGLRVRLEGGRARVECRMFSSAVEKGVLLRGRVLAASGPAGDDVRWATAAAEAFAASPPMLST